MRRIVLTSLGLILTGAASLALVQAAKAQDDRAARQAESPIDRALFAGPLGVMAEKMRDQTG